MRITRMLLENFIGVKSGMGISIFEVDFPKKKHGIVLFRGNNGSGKTTILSHAQPFHQSNDSRKSQIIDGKDGRKEIDIEDGENEYICEIHYKYKKGGGHTTKCYISKNGEQLNNNGNISSYEEYLNSELGITKDYFRLGRIGSNVSSFIDLSKTERKKYISKLLPDIEKYLRPFANVNRKHAEIKTKVKYLMERLSKIPDELELHSRKKTIQNDLDGIKVKIVDIVKEIGQKEQHKQNILSEMKLIKESNQDFFDNTSSLQREYRLNKRELERLYDTMNETLEVDEIPMKVKEIEGKLNVALLDIKNNDTNIVNLQKDVAKSKLELSDIKRNVTNLSPNMKLEVENRKKMLEDKILELTSFCEEDVNYEHLKSIKDLNIIKNDLNAMMNALQIFSSNMFSHKDSFDKMNDAVEISYQKSELEKKRDLIWKNISTLESNLSKYNLLQKRPSDCHIDTCPFIKDSIQFSGVKEDIVANNVKLKDINNQIDSLSTILDNYNEFKVNYDKFMYVISTINVRSQQLFINMFKLDFINVVTMYDEPLNTFNRINSESSDAKQTISYLIELKRVKVEHSNNDVKYESYLNNEAMYNAIKSQVINIENRLANTSNDLEKLYELQYSLNDNKLNIENTLSSLNSILTILDSVLLHENNLLIYDEYSDLDKESMMIRSELSILDDSLTKLRIVERKYENGINNINSQLDNITEFNKDKDEIEKSLKHLILVKNALDVKSGIPLIFSREYLKSIRVHVNNLLALAFPNMTIDFSLTDKEFGIYVTDAFTREIEDLSQGEKILTKISFSVGLIKSILKKHKWNILYFDEVDSTLDVDRKSAVMDLLQKQIEYLNIEQVFMISHNELLDNMDVNIVALSSRQDDMIREGNVIWSIDNKFPLTDVIDSVVV